MPLSGTFNVSIHSLKEQVASAIWSDDLRGRVTECDLDRVIAMGWSDPLGCELWRARIGGDTRAVGRAHALLLREVLPLASAWRCEAQRIGRLCALVLAEWLDDRCRACHGRGVVGTGRGGVRYPGRPCPRCEGTGMRRPVHAARARALGVSRQAYSRRWAARYEIVSALLRRHYLAEQGILLERLGRRAGA